MFLIRNRQEYREYLLLMEKGIKTQLEQATKQKDINNLKGQLYGIALALDGLDAWENQDESR